MLSTEPGLVLHPNHVQNMGKAAYSTLNESLYVFFIFFLFLFFYKKFMPISARGTTVAQANSECTLITIRMYLSVI